MSGDIIPEKRDDFFTARLDGYDEHMLGAVSLLNYQKVAEPIPVDTQTLLQKFY